MSDHSIKNKHNFLKNYVQALSFSFGFVLLYIGAITLFTFFIAALFFLGAIGLFIEIMKNPDPYVSYLSFQTLLVLIIPAAAIPAAFIGRKNWLTGFASVLSFFLMGEVLVYLLYYSLGYSTFTLLSNEYLLIGTVGMLVYVLASPTLTKKRRVKLAEKAAEEERFRETPEFQNFQSWLKTQTFKRGQDPRSQRNGWITWNYAEAIVFRARRPKKSFWFLGKGDKYIAFKDQLVTEKSLREAYEQLVPSPKKPEKPVEPESFIQLPQNMNSALDFSAIAETLEKDLKLLTTEERNETLHSLKFFESKEKVQSLSAKEVGMLLDLCGFAKGSRMLQNVITKSLLRWNANWPLMQSKMFEYKGNLNYFSTLGELSSGSSLYPRSVEFSEELLPFSFSQHASKTKTIGQLGDILSLPEPNEDQIYLLLTCALALKDINPNFKRALASVITTVPRYQKQEGLSEPEQIALQIFGVNLK